MLVTSIQSLASASSKSQSTPRSSLNLSPVKQPSASHKNVKFHQIEIREYEQILADNPSVSCGPPLGLGWEYNSKPLVYSVEEYETQMKPNRRVRSEMIMPQHIRETKLQADWHVTTAEIAERMREIRNARQQRRTTIRNTDQLEQFIHVWSSGVRRLKRVVFSKKKERSLRKIISKTRRCVKSMNDLTSAGGNYELDESIKLDQNNKTSSDDLIPEDEDEMRGFNDTFRLFYNRKQKKKILRRQGSGRSLLSSSNHSDDDLRQILEDGEWFVEHDLDKTRAHHHKLVNDNNEDSSDPLLQEENDEEGKSNAGDDDEKEEIATWNSDDPNSEDFYNPPPIEEERFVKVEGDILGGVDECKSDDELTKLACHSLSLQEKDDRALHAKRQKEEKNK